MGGFGGESQAAREPLVLTDEMFTSIFDKPIPYGKILCADEETLDGLNKMMAEVGIEAQIDFEEETKGENWRS